MTRTLLLVDDHALIRAGVRALVLDIPGYTVIGEASDGAQVLATGGGAVLDPDNCRCLAGRGFVVYLCASVEEQLRRTRLDNQRPLLQTADPGAKLAQLFAQRDPLYRAIADCVIATEGYTPGQVVRDLMRQWENRPS